MCLESGGRVNRSHRQHRLVEKTTKMRVTISKRKLPRSTDKPQKTPATILKKKKDHPSKGSWILPKSGLWISSRWHCM